MSIELKPWNLAPDASPQNVWLNIIKNLTPETLISLMQEVGVPVGLGDADGTTQTTGQYFITTVVDSFHGHFLSKKPWSLSEAKNKAEELLMIFLTHGEDPFPSKEPLFFLKRCLELGWSSTATYLLEHAECPQNSSLDNIKINLYTSNPPYRKYTTFWTHFLVQKGPDDFLNLWLDKGVDINIKDKEGQTPLCYATTPERVKFLLEKGADPKILDNRNIGLRTIWAERGVPLSTVDEMEKLLPKATSNEILESATVAEIKTVLSSMDSFTSWKNNPGPAIPLNLDWESLFNHRFTRKAGGQDFSLHALDFVALCLIESRPNAIFSADPSQLQYVELCKSLIEGIEVFKSNQLKLSGQDGFLFRWVCEDVFHVQESLATPEELIYTPPKNVYDRSKPIKCPHSIFKQWQVSWDEGKSLGPLLAKFAGGAAYFSPLIDEIKQQEFMVRVVRELFIKNLDKLDKFSRESFWSNPDSLGLTPLEHGQFWSGQLRNSNLSSAWMDFISSKERPLSIPEDPAHRAAAFGVMTQYYFSEQSKVRSRSRHTLKEVTSTLERWISVGADWPAEVLDKKWFSKKNRLRETDLGLQLSSLASAGWLQNRLGDAEEKITEKPKAPRLRL